MKSLKTPRVLMSDQYFCTMRNDWFTIDSKLNDPLTLSSP